MRIRGACLLVAAGLFLAGCGGTDTPTPDIPTGAVPSGPVDTPTPELVTPSPGAQEVRAVSWDRVEVIDENTVEVAWWSGVEPCHVLDHVETTTDQDTITITLFEGSRAGPVEVCVELAVRKRTRIHLDEPVAGREIVDGADAPAVPSPTGASPATAG